MGQLKVRRETFGERKKKSAVFRSWESRRWKRICRGKKNLVENQRKAIQSRPFGRGDDNRRD